MRRLVSRGGRSAAQELLDLRFALDRLDLPVDLRGVLDVEAAAHVRRVAAEDAAVDDLPAALDRETADYAAEDVQAAAVLDEDVAVDRAAHVALAPLGNGEVAADRAPQLQVVADGDVAGDGAAFFPHASGRSVVRYVNSGVASPSACRRPRLLLICTTASRTIAASGATRNR